MAESKLIARIYGNHADLSEIGKLIMQEENIGNPSLSKSSLDFSTGSNEINSDPRSFLAPLMNAFRTRFLLPEAFATMLAKLIFM